MIKFRPLYERQADPGSAPFAIIFYSKTPYQHKTVEDSNLETDIMVTVSWQNVLRVDCWLFLLKFRWVSRR